LRQFGAVVSGAVMAAEAHAASERIGVLDPVTGLHDRRSAETYLRRELARARRYREPLSLVLIDLDRFSELNEQRGYAFGDRALREIAKLLIGFPSTSREMTGIALCFRESDLAARVGADEFLVLLPATPRAGASQAAERFLAGLRQHRVVYLEGGPESARLTATAAVVSFPEDGDTAEGLTTLANRKHFDESHKVRTHERLAAGQTDRVESVVFDTDPSDAGDLLVGEHLGAGEPRHALGRHAVRAAEIAAIRD